MADNAFSDDSAPPPPRSNNPPQTPVTRHAPVDQGLNDWAELVHGHLANQNGVEITAKEGAAVHFKFRGQTFSVHVHRTG